LTEDEKQRLGKTLKKFPKLFGGGLGMLNIKPVKLELIDGAKPYHAIPIIVPQSLEMTKKTEMKRLTDIDVFNALYIMYIRAGHRGRRRMRENHRMLSLVDYTDAHRMEVAQGNSLVIVLTKYA
jgi:hypothetical protein